MNQTKLYNKHIIISAAADGIGWSIAKVCMSHGAKVYITDKDEVSLEKLSKNPLYNKKLFLNKVNANNSNEVEKYFKKTINKIGKIHGLINNIGIAGPTGRLEKLNIQEWKETIDTNINSHFYFSKFSIPLLKKNLGGSIINISSTAGLFGFPFRSPYSTSKWGLIGLTKTLAIELGKYNIRVNAICPGSVLGNRMKRVIKAKSKAIRIDEKKIRKNFESMVSLKTFVESKDIANMVIFLLSNESSKISGQVMTVDGNTERMN